MWSAGLAEWFAGNGRHRLPWRLTGDPWAVLVSEVMLQQTSVSRVLGRWERFIGRWPRPVDCARAGLDDVLREWQGLGYPRRARALWLTAGRVAVDGWPGSEAALRSLPGVGIYTARALLAFSDLDGEPASPPRDVNIGRVAARAALGLEPHEVAPAELDACVAAGHGQGLSLRDYSHALFDVGAGHCRARARCQGCPLQGGCTARLRETDPATPARRGSRYEGSLRQLRGLLLARALAAPGASSDELVTALGGVAGGTPERARAALAGLVADGLVAARAERPPG